jgi:hypothetical protein
VMKQTGKSETSTDASWPTYALVRLNSSYFPSTKILAILPFLLLKYSLTEKGIKGAH